MRDRVQVFVGRAPPHTPPCPSHHLGLDHTSGRNHRFTGFMTKLAKMVGKSTENPLFWSENRLKSTVLDREMAEIPLFWTEKWLNPTVFGQNPLFSGQKTHCFRAKNHCFGGKPLFGAKASMGGKSQYGRQKPVYRQMPV